MAYTSLLRTRTLAQKRVKSLFVAHLEEGTESDEISGTVTGTYKIGNIPANAVIVDAYVHVKAVSDAATSCTAKLGTTDGGAEIMAAANVKAATGKVGSLVGQILTGSGKAVYMTLTVTGASTNVGDYIFVVEYVEYDKTTGEYTSVID